MELAAILLAKAMAFVEPVELNPKGAVATSAIIKAIVTRYGFQGFPQKPEDFDDTKGIAFTKGRFDGIDIDALTLFKFGIVLDTRTSTRDSKRLLEEAFQWSSKDLGFVYKPSMVDRWQYTSQLTFHSKVPLLGIHPAFQRLADALARSAEELVGDKLKYDVTALQIDYDELERKHPLGRFSIQRRENTPFSANKYYSDAPLHTDIHLKLLAEFEADNSRKA